jgi:hypothetical protein
MALVTQLVTIGTAVTRICHATSGPLHLMIHSDSNTEVWLGGVDVTTSTGFHTRKEDTLQFNLMPGNTLYGIAATPAPIILMEQQL